MILTSLQRNSSPLEQFAQQMLTVSTARQEKSMINIFIATWILTFVVAWMVIITGNLLRVASIVSYSAIVVATNLVQ